MKIHPRFWRMGPTRSIADFFPASKRVKQAQVLSASSSSSCAAVDEKDRSGFEFRRLSSQEISQVFAFGGSSSPSLQDHSSSSLEKALAMENKEYPVEEQDRIEALESPSKEQRMRMGLNKSMACATRKLRLCEEAVRASQGSFPDLKKLLVEPSWMEVVEGEFKKSYMEQLQSFVKQEAVGKIPIYPPPAKVFNAFNTCPFDRVKVVLLGQDPYHGPGQAMGLSFSVPKGIKIPSSLLNMYKEIHDDVGCSVPSHGNLERWAYQGVLLLNTVLTVRDHQANSHANKGWEAFTDAAISAISKKRSGVVFLLWGNSAHAKIRLIDTKAHHVLKAAHPSGLSAHRGFFGCRHFSKANALLEAAGILPIDWQL